LVKKEVFFGIVTILIFYSLQKRMSDREWKSSFERRIGGKNVTVYFNPPNITNTTKSEWLSYTFDVDSVPDGGKYILQKTIWNTNTIIREIEIKL